MYHKNNLHVIHVHVGVIPTHTQTDSHGAGRTVQASCEKEECHSWTQVTGQTRYQTASLVSTYHSVNAQYIAQHIHVHVCTVLVLMRPFRQKHTKSSVSSVLDTTRNRTSLSLLTCAVSNSLSLLSSRHSYQGRDQTYQSSVMYQRTSLHCLYDIVCMCVCVCVNE